METTPSRLDLAKQIAVEAGKKILHSDATQDIEKKEGRGNIVTSGDKASEHIILSSLKSYFPDDVVISEESDIPEGDLLSLPRTWIIDPIDGTNNFRYDRQYCAVSIAYAEKGVVKIAAVYDPYRDELFFSEKGSGAWNHNQRISVSDQKNIHHATIGTDNSYDPEGTKKNLELFLRIQPSPWVLIKGSSVLGMCDVACGRMDVYFQTCLKPWDLAACVLIVEEAGGVVRDLQGRSISYLSQEVVVGNKYLVDQCIRCFL